MKNCSCGKHCKFQQGVSLREHRICSQHLLDSLEVSGQNCVYLILFGLRCISGWSSYKRSNFHWEPSHLPPFYRPLRWCQPLFAGARGAGCQCLRGGQWDALIWQLRRLRPRNAPNLQAPDVLSWAKCKGARVCQGMPYGGYGIPAYSRND